MSSPSDNRPLSPSPSSKPVSRPTSPTSIDGWGSHAGTSTERPITRLDDTFNFQIVVFQVEDTLFQVLKNGFNVPGTPFESMFALPQTPIDIVNSPIEGSTLSDPIYLPGIKVKYFRAFLRILYPFIGQVPVVGYDDWVGVLDLATMWFFTEIRTKAIAALAELIKEKPILERISLARKYRVPDWLKDGYVEIAMKRPLQLEELLPRDSQFEELSDKDQNSALYWKESSEKWETTAQNWEAVARICTIQTNASTSAMGYGEQYCDTCAKYYGNSYPDYPACKCRIGTMVEEVFRKELERLKDNVEHIEPSLPVTTGKKKKKKKGGL
ncbi:hypothetical protein CPB84DRAFT_937594 [Gymnopilus junonius]|uniref:BTB domain-containing protein n=1 Tax=Gymnopilus junonius TaxID=109634 RepID=A0A9P5TT33_GYMJU|nr:hypothetical protein CPB84DRAFT_937594 [Gymnopilus junonius]